MGQTLAIWKWRPAWPFRSERRVWQAIADDRAPLALTRFDAQALASTLRVRFGEGADAPFQVDVCDFKGHRANWLVLSASWGTAEDTFAELVKVCTAQGLHIYAT